MAQARTPPTGKVGRPFYGIQGFAHLFLTTFRIRRHDDIRTEQLAEAFRQIYHLPPFPTLDELRELCERLEIPVDRLPTGSPDLPGANTWHQGGGAAIYLSQDLSRQRAETTICHELREVLENTFKWSKPFYSGLDTADNRRMHQESEHFAGCLLMQARATRERLRENGYDFAEFAREKDRSLPSVILRAQGLYPAGAEEPGPVSGVWLFEAPWERVRQGTATLDLMSLRYRSHLNGFSMNKTGSAEAQLARFAFPRKGMTASELPAVQDAFDSGRPVVHQVAGFDMFGERNFILAAEPFVVGETPWRVLVTAVRTDFSNAVQPWLRRLGSGVAVGVAGS